MDYIYVNGIYLFSKKSLDRSFKDELYEKLKVVKISVNIIGETYLNKFSKRKLNSYIRKISSCNDILDYPAFIEYVGRLVFDAGVSDCIYNLASKVEVKGCLSPVDEFRRCLSADFYPNNKNLFAKELSLVSKGCL